VKNWFQSLGFQILKLYRCSLVELLLERGAHPDGEVERPGGGRGGGGEARLGRSEAHSDAVDGLGVRLGGLGWGAGGAGAGGRAGGRGGLGSASGHHEGEEGAGGDEDGYRLGIGARAPRPATPLLLAVSVGRPDLVELLASHGADAELAAPCDAAALRAAAAAGVAGDGGDGAGRWTLGREVTSETAAAVAAAAAAEAEVEAEVKASTDTPEGAGAGARAGAGSPQPSHDKDVRPAPHTPKASGGAVTSGKRRRRLIRPLQLAASLGDAQCAAALLGAGAARSAPADMPPLICAAAGAGLDTTFQFSPRCFAFKTHSSMIASIVHATNLTPLGSDNPSRACGQNPNHIQLMTARIVHVTNLRDTRE
jgi:hypothetical protein